MKIKTLFITVILLFFGYVYTFSGDFYQGISGTVDSNGTWVGGSNEFKAEKGSQTNISINPDTSPVMTITLQRKLEGDSAWGEHVVDEWTLTATSPDMEYVVPSGGTEPEDCYYRIGCDVLADYTSGNCTCRLGGGRK